MATYNFYNSSDTQSESSFNSSSDTQLSDMTETESYTSDTSDFELKRQYGLDTDENGEQLSDTKTVNDDKLKELMKIDYTYPELDDVNFQEKMFKKREFYYHRIQQREKMDNYNDVKAYRETACKGQPKLLPQQAFIGNFMNEQTPFRSVLLYHGMGSGKCLLPDELVYVNSKLVTIKDLYDDETDGTFIIDDEQGIWTKPKRDIYINSYDTNSKIMKLKRVEKMYKEFIEQDVRKITLENGLEINLTKAHKLLQNDDWTNTLKVGDYVQVPTTLHDTNINDETILSEYGVKIIATFLHLCETQSDLGDYLMEELENGTDITTLNRYNQYLLTHNIIIKPHVVPTIIMQASKQMIKLFLNIYNNLSKNVIMSESKYFIYQICHLAKLVHMQFIITNNDDMYTIILNKKSSQLFSSTIKQTENIQIIKIEEYAYTGYVYDLEIKDVHNYCANLFLTHNTCAGITIAEQFKSMVTKYGTKIYILVPGPLIKENWKNELLKCTGETYLKQQDMTGIINEDEKKRIKSAAVNAAFQFYTFQSYKSFYKKVLGEKITERLVDTDEKVKVTFRKNAEGDFERDFTTDRITELNNTILIVDEAHNLTNNSYGDALLKIIKNSHNLKIVLLTGTPMKNLASDIIELLNFIRPPNDPIIRDKVFTKHTNHEMDFVKGGVDYLKKMTRGYVSYLRGGDPLTMATRVDVGVVGNGMLFTKITKCYMLDFQQATYDVEIETIDVLGRNSAAVANFAFPKLGDDKNIIGCFGLEGVNTVKNQLRVHGDIINKKLATEILKDDNLKNRTDLIYINDKTNMITGKFLHLDYLKHFSIKFHDCLINLNKLVSGKEGAKTAFVYSNLVVVGVEMFQEVLLMNGYLEYNEEYKNYKIEDNTVCYYCGKSHISHDNKGDSIKGMGALLPDHKFRPATFVTVTGKSSDEAEMVIPEEKQRILNNVFSNVDNIDGKNIKFVVGSRVMNEGLSLYNVAEVHILDVYYNLSKVDQTIGRAIRHCRHYDVMDEKNPYPEVKVYKYCISLEKHNPKLLSSDEELYKKAELKYLLVKKVERAIKENAIDCPLNRNGNIFPEELIKYKNCTPPTEATKDTKVICPDICDFMDCEFKCDDDKLNKNFFDEETKKYRQLEKNEIDMTTFNNNLAVSEIRFAKEKIKELFRVKYLYLLKDILNYVKNSYDNDQRDLFDNFFVFAALDKLIPTTENDFNNFADTVYDKYNRPGYIIYVSKYYIFQPFDQPHNVPMYYRSTLDKPLQNSLSLVHYLKNIKGIKETTEFATKDVESVVKSGIYNFDTNYYENRQEFKLVGTIDKEPSKKKIKEEDELVDVFKLRRQRGKILDKKRGADIYTLYGSVCFNSFKKEELLKFIKDLNIKLDDSRTRPNLCELIKNRLLFLEKYSTKKNNNKFTYVMIPTNHKEYKFPYNLEDRKDFMMNDLKNKLGTSIDINVKKINGKVSGEEITNYAIEIKDSGKLTNYHDFLKELGFVLEKGMWIHNVN